jgi:hypothetical protein
VKLERISLILTLSAASLFASVGVRADYRYDDPHYGYPPPPSDYERRPDPGYCDYYARERAERYARAGHAPLGGAVRGGVGGAGFWRHRRRQERRTPGAIAGAGLAVIANGVRNERERDYAYTRAYDDCMSGFRR